jgi:hypothetical protein
MLTTARITKFLGKPEVSQKIQKFSAFYGGLVVVFVIELT